MASDEGAFVGHEVLLASVYARSLEAVERHCDTVTGPLLVGTDGRASADPAITAARVFAKHLAADVQLFSVLEPANDARGSTTAPATPATPAARVQSDRRVLLEMAVQAQKALTAGEETEWPLTILDGALGPAVRDATRAVGARLVIVGRHHHSMVGRALGRDSLIRILEWAVTPVLAATSRLTEVPSCGVVAIDFSPASIRAAQVARHLLRDNGTLYLVHVCPTMGADARSNATSQLEAAYAGLVHVRRALRGDTSIQIQPIVLFGVAGVELLAFADGIGADLIACGTRTITPPHSLRDRLHAESVATRLIDRTPCSIVIVPNRSTE